MQSDIVSNTSTRTPGKLVIPFITTSPILDVGVLIGLVPLWWLLGIESLILPVGLLIILAKGIVFRKEAIRIPPVAQLLTLFLFIYLISGFFIIEEFRWISFIRTLSVYLSVTVLLLIVFNFVRDWKDIKFLIKVIVFVMGIVSLFGFLAILGIWRPKFDTMLGNLLPGWIANTSYGKTFVTRSLGNFGFFQYIGRYYRVRGIFTFATLYASALAVIIPLLVYARLMVKSKIVRLVLLGILILAGVNLLFTTGRAAILSLVIGGAIYAFLIQRKYRQIREVIWFLTIFSLIIIGMSFVEDYNLIPGNPIPELANDLLGSRGSSTEHRLTVYQYTIQGWLERPIFGWGTERDIEGFKFPAGSHSYYLSILYRQGILGLTVFILIMTSIWKTTRPLKIKPFSRKSFQQIKLLEFGRWVFIVAVIDSLTTVPVTDIVTMILLWLIFSILISTRDMCLRTEHRQVQTIHV
jgi:hypothetical protein